MSVAFSMPGLGFYTAGGCFAGIVRFIITALRMSVADSILIRVLEMGAGPALIADAITVFIAAFTATAYIAAGITDSIRIRIRVHTRGDAFSILAASRGLGAGWFRGTGCCFSVMIFSVVCGSCRNTGRQHK